MMEALLIYILKSGVLLSIFFLAYFLLLKNDTSFKLNRWYFISGFIVSFLLPAIEFTRTTLVTLPSFPADFNSIPVPASGGAIEAEAAINWWVVAGSIYLAGVFLILVRFIIRLISLQQFLQKSSVRKENGFSYIAVSEEINPFSFFRYIVYNPESHDIKELEMILEHERVHASQWHSADVLSAHIATGILWFNPLAWLYKKFLLQNLEYIADRDTAKVSASTKEYQKALIRISAGDLQPLLANHFYQSLIKKRIVMLNKKSTSKTNFWKTGLILPLLLVFILGFQVKSEARMISGTKVSRDSIPNITEISITIDSNSSEKSMAEAADFLRNRGITLQFNNIQRTDEGAIIAIEASYKTKDGSIGNYSQTNSDGINPFMFYVKESGETGFKAATSLTAEAASASGSNSFHKIGKEPLVMLEGKSYQTNELYGKYILLKDGFEVLSPEETFERFGKRSKDGALIIPRGEITNGFKGALKNLHERGEGMQEYIFFKANMQPSYITARKSMNETVHHEGRKSKKSIYLSNATFTTDSSSFIQKWSASHIDTSDTNASQFQNSNNFFISSGDKKPLIVIDGEVMEPDFQMSSIDPDNIEKLNVLKEESATKKYGEKGKDGAIEISLKKQNSSTIHGTGKKETGGATGTIHIRSNNKENSKSITIIGTGKSNGEKNAPLYIINGEEMEKDFDSSTIDPDTIESINVLKGDNAVAKHGEKAAHGAIEITIKEE